MIIKNITLENIRSYKATTTIRLGAGTTLLFGDIGAGKSTLLYGLEFALFGLSTDLDAKDLLRQGEDQGSVTVELEVAGETVAIGRVLKRSGGSITQSSGYISRDGEKTGYAAAEMKTAVLKLLDLNEEVGRSGSALYRYGIFTPQDEMKAILAAKEDDRLRTLRRALRVEDYATAAENGDALRLHLDRQRKELERQAEGLELLRTQKAEFEITTAELEHAAAQHDLAASEAESSATAKEAEIAKHQKVLLTMEAAKGEMAGLTVAIDAREGEIAGVEERRRTALNRKAGLESDLRESGVVLSGKEDGEALQDELQNLETGAIELVKASVRAESSVESLESLIKNGTCPTCEQKIDARAFGAKCDEAKAAAEKLARQAKDTSDRASAVRSTIAAIGLAASVADIVADVAAHDGKIKTLAADLNEKSRLCEDKQRFLSENAGLGETIEKLHAEVALSRAEHTKEVAAASSARTGAKAAARDAARVSDEIKDKERCQAKAARFRQLSSWVSGLLVPAIAETEKAVLDYNNQHFCSEFTNWFNLLTRSDDIQVWVDDAFGPVVQQGEYELGLKSLSGGERTSLALAYRLALNRLVRGTSPAIAGGVIILDEPTDGLHKDQLINMRDVLDQLGCGQTILVSHEEELMDCADRVIRFEKTRGISTVAAE